MTIEQTEFVASVKLICRAEYETQTIYLSGRFEFFGIFHSDFVSLINQAAQRPIAADQIHSDPDARAPLIAEPPGRHQRGGDRGGLGRAGGVDHGGDAFGEDEWYLHAE